MKKIFLIIFVILITCTSFWVTSSKRSTGVVEPTLSTTYSIADEKHHKDYVEYSSELIDTWQKNEANEKNRYNDQSLYGDWFTPHSAPCPNIFFHKDNTFSMWDMEGDTDVYRVGKFSVKNDSVYLHCKNGKMIVLRHWRACADGKAKKYQLEDSDNVWSDIDYVEDQYYITGNGYWLVKGN